MWPGISLPVASQDKEHSNGENVTWRGASHSHYRTEKPSDNERFERLPANYLIFVASGSIAADRRGETKVPQVPQGASDCYKSYS